MSNQDNKTITAIDGVSVGHSSDFTGGTGVTVIMFDNPAIGALDITGLATSTRQTDSLNMMHASRGVHAICLAGGSAFGLDAASGVVRFLEERNVGLDLSVARLPIVPSAVIFDLSFMDAKARPTADMGYDACLNTSADEVEQGCIGAGTGATCGKLRGVLNATKSGLGSSLITGDKGIRVGALVVANPFGDILGNTGNIIAGARDGSNFLNMHKMIATGEVRNKIGSPSNTTLCVIITDALMDKVMAMQVARMAGNGLARHISPFNTPFDGDMVFCLSVGNKQAHPLHLGVAAERAATQALMNAVKNAQPMGGLPSSKVLLGNLPLL